MWSVKNVGSCPSAAASSRSTSSATTRIRARYASTVRCSAGASSAGQRFGWNQKSSISASPVGRSAPTVHDSFRSGGVSVPSE